MTTAEYNACVDAHADGLFRFILKNIRNEEKAMDIVQDTYEKMWIKRDTITASKAKSYMFTTAYHRLVDVVRKDKKVTDFDEVHENTHGHSRQYSDLSELLNAAIDLLPAMQKAVLMMRDYEGYNYAEIGEMTGLKESQVKVYIFRARKFLKNYLVSIDTVI